MTKAQLIFSILNTARGGQVANTEAISEEQIGFQCDLIRAKLIRQDLAKKRTLSHDLVQTICINMTQADASDCPCEVAGCQVLKSTINIPPAIELNDKNLIVSVGPVDLTMPRFNLIRYYRAI